MSSRSEYGVGGFTLPLRETGLRSGTYRPNCQIHVS